MVWKYCNENMELGVFYTVVTVYGLFVTTTTTFGIKFNLQYIKAITDTKLKKEMLILSIISQVWFMLSTPLQLGAFFMVGFCPDFWYDPQSHNESIYFDFFSISCTITYFAGMLYVTYMYIIFIFLVFYFFCQINWAGLLSVCKTATQSTQHATHQ